LDFANLEHQLEHHDHALRLIAAAEETMRRIQSTFHQGSQNLIARIRREHPFSEAVRTQYELEGVRMSVDEAVMYALNPSSLEIKEDPRSVASSQF
jgi:hypothetical protein